MRHGLNTVALLRARTTPTPADPDIKSEPAELVDLKAARHFSYCPSLVIDAFQLHRTAKAAKARCQEAYRKAEEYRQKHGSYPPLFHGTTWGLALGTVKQ